VERRSVKRIVVASVLFTDPLDLPTSASGLVIGRARESQPILQQRRRCPVECGKDRLKPFLDRPRLLNGLH